MQVEQWEYTQENLQLLYDYILPYLQEGLSAGGIASYGEFCSKTSWETLYTALAHEDCTVFVATHDGYMCGVAIVIKYQSWFKGYEGDIDFFYIRPEDRGCGSSRLLVQACIGLKDSLKLNVLYASCQSLIGDKNNNLYKNLFAKQGFKVTGCSLHYTGD